MAEKFIERGHTILGCARSSEAIEDLGSRYPGPHDFQVLDVTADDQVEEWAQDLGERYGAPDLLINNAAIINRNAPAWEIGAREFDEVIDVNVKGVMNVMRHFLPAMIEQESGVVVNFSSGWGRSTSPEVAPYCATKWAIEGLTQSIAQELPEGMAAVPLNPGVINTDMLKSCFGPSASQCPDPSDWVEEAVTTILHLSSRDNGRSASV